MYLMKKKFLCALIFFIIYPVKSENEEFQKIELYFDIFYQDLKIGEELNVLYYNKKNYKIISTTKPLGFAKLFIKEIQKKSYGIISNTGLIPIKYMILDKKKGNSSATFNWSTNELILKFENQKKLISISTNIIDQQSFLYNFTFTKLFPKSKIFYITDTKRVKKYFFLNNGKEELETKLCIKKTVHLKRFFSEKSKKSFELWLAPSLNLLPVRVHFTDKKGRMFKTLITKIKIH